MNKTVSITITIILIALVAFIFSVGKNDSPQGAVVKDGVQYITINARGGYSPRVSQAAAGIPTKLIMKTNGTFDCSRSLAIRSLGFQEVLPQSGEKEIDIGIPQAGVPLVGVCSMGMYSFQVNFI